jgi:hypothetical protein
MRWTPGDRGNIEDMRGRSGGMAMGAGGLGVGGLLLLLVLSWATGIDLTSIVGGGSPRPPDAVGTSGKVTASPEEERLVDMVDAVMDDAQGTWQQLLGGRYQDTKAVLFRDAINSACGFAQAATGPFYCPADRKVYLDLGFFDELHRKLGAPGDFAQAYVLAHELGHHVHADMLRGLAIEVGMIWAGLAVAAALLDPIFRALGWGDWRAPAALPLLACIAEAAGLLAMPLFNAFSRHVERAADRYALDLTDKPAAFAEAMRKLASQNLIEADPPRWAEWLLYTHPPVAQRIRMAEGYARA